MQAWSRSTKPTGSAGCLQIHQADPQDSPNPLLMIICSLCNTLSSCRAPEYIESCIMSVTMNALGLQPNTVRQCVSRFVRHQKLLSSGRTASSRMAPCRCQQEAFTVVGKGRVGTAIAEMGANDVLVGRGENVPETPAGPVIVCTRNDDLEGVVEATPAHRRGDLVFIQNGMLQPWLDAKGLSDNTQVLVYFAVAKKGEKPLDGKTDRNPEGLTAAWGPHAAAIAQRLQDSDLSCKLPNQDAFKQAMLEKLIWICAYMVVGARHKAKVGEVEQAHKDEVTLLIEELARGGASALGITMADGYVERLHAYSRSVAHFPTAVKEFAWRNGWFYNHSERAKAEGKPDPYPTHTAWLTDLGVL